MHDGHKKHDLDGSKYEPPLGLNELNHTYTRIVNAFSVLSFRTSLSYAFALRFYVH